MSVTYEEFSGPVPFYWGDYANRPGSLDQLLVEMSLPMLCKLFWLSKSVDWSVDLSFDASVFGFSSYGTASGSGTFAGSGLALKPPQRVGGFPQSYPINCFDEDDATKAIGSFSCESWDSKLESQRMNEDGSPATPPYNDLGYLHGLFFGRGLNDAGGNPVAYQDRTTNPFKYYAGLSVGVMAGRLYTGDFAFLDLGTAPLGGYGGMDLTGSGVGFILSVGGVPLASIGMNCPVSTLTDNVDGPPDSDGNPTVLTGPGYINGTVSLNFNTFWTP